MDSQQSEFLDGTNLNLAEYTASAKPCVIYQNPTGETRNSSTLRVPDVTDDIDESDDVEDDVTGDDSAQFPDHKCQIGILPETSGPPDGTSKLIETDDTDDDTVVGTFQPTFQFFKSGKIKMVVPPDNAFQHLLGNDITILCHASTPLSSPIKLNTVDQLNTLNDRLQNDLTYRQQLLCSLQKQGGKTKGTVVTNALRFLLTDSLASQYNWIGSFKKGHTGAKYRKKPKNSFKALEHVTALVINVGLNLFRSETNDEDKFVRALEENIKTWLKQAPGRLRAERNKSSIKAETSQSPHLNETEEEDDY